MLKSVFFLFFASACFADSYSWLEDLESDQTKEWVAGQMALSDGYFQQTAKNANIAHLLDKNTNFTSYHVPVVKQGKAFYCKRCSSSDAYSLYVDDRLLIQPGQNESLSGFEVDSSGEKLTFSLSNSGSDVNVWHFLNTETGDHYPDTLEGLKFCEPIWDSSGSGVYYTRFIGKENKSQAIYYHKLGSTQKDKLLFDTKDLSEWYVHILDEVETGKYLLLSAGKILGNNGIYLFDIESQTLSEVLPPSNAPFEFAFQRDDRLFFVSDNQLIAVGMNDLKVEQLLPKGEDLLQEAYCTQDHIVCSYLKNATSTLKVYDFAGQLLFEPILPGRGSILASDSQTNGLFFLYTDYFTPSAIYKLDTETGSTKSAYETDQSWDSSDYVMEQKFYTSKDGTQVPLFLLYKKDTKLDGNRPTLLYGYGGFNISITPSYSPLTLTWLDMGGIYASVSLRGGGEYGEEWHEAGKKENKQTVFDDFTSAALALVDWGYTTHKKIAINGRSNGGLLVGACLTQRPDLFGAAIPQVGVLDMLNFHKHTIGWAWCTEYGTPEDPKDYQVLHSYSPCHNIQKEISYPPTLITTADHDDRVVPFHSYKFAAALQDSKETGAPHLLKIYPNSGHSSSRSKELWMRENLDILMFLQRELIDANH